ncbi:MAG: hypothetical protein ACI4F4_05845 [Lachnospiraceae bacterium]
MVNRVIKIVFCAVFFLVMLVPLVTVNTKSDVVSVTENRTLASMPDLRDEDGNWNKSFISQFESWFNDNVGLREQMLGINTTFQYDIFHSSPNNVVKVGKEGWLFYAGENNLKIASGTYPSFDEAVLYQICQEQIQVRDKLAKQGIEYVIVLFPSKVSIYPENLYGDFCVRTTPADELADYLEANSDLKVVRVKDRLLQAKEENDDLLFFKTDTHWNSYGCYEGYKEIIDDLNKWEISDTESVDTGYVEVESVRDLSMLIANNEKYGEYGKIKNDIINPTGKAIKKGKQYDVIQEYVKMKGIRRGDYYRNKNKELPSFLLFGDSMFMDWMGPLLSQNCSELTAIWDYSISQELINELEPDVVFFEMTERNLNLLPAKQIEFVNSNEEE